MQPGKPKNLILLQLGGVSRAGLWQYRLELGSVWRLLAGALSFDRFFASSTSAGTLAEDVLFGDTSVRHASLWGELAKHGYRQEEDLAGISAAKRGKRPFCVYFRNVFNIPPVPDRSGTGGFAFPEDLRAAYTRGDAFVSGLLVDLERQDLLADTVIACFGSGQDSGGDPRPSPLPYADQTWVPLGIYCPGRFEGGSSDRLISAVDLKATLWNLLLPEEVPLPRHSLYAGVDVFETKRKFAFSRNASTPQADGAGGYAVMDGAYRLLAVTSEGNRKGGGMELYCDQADPANSLNLLKFFRPDSNGGLGAFVMPPALTAKHFHSVFGPEQTASLAAAYRKLQPELIRFMAEAEMAREGEGVPR